jgi:hypothetical protein
MIELADFENMAIALKERETDIFRGKAELAHCAVEYDQVYHWQDDPPPRTARYLAHLWGRSAQYVNTLARIFETFSEDEITPNIPLSLWNAVMETDDPQAWLAQALAEGLSARGVRDANDNLRGKHLSSTAFRGRCQVVEWDVPASRVTVEGLPISGDAPDVMDVVAREVLG